MRSIFLNVIAFGLFATKLVAGEYTCVFTAAVGKIVATRQLEIPSVSFSRVAEFSLKDVLYSSVTDACDTLEGSKQWLELGVSPQVAEGDETKLTVSFREVQGSEGELAEEAKWSLGFQSLGLGSKGATAFYNELTVYKNKTQPKCSQCYGLTVVYDPKTDDSGLTPVEGLVISSDKMLCQISHGKATANPVQSNLSKSALKFSIQMNYRGLYLGAEADCAAPVGVTVKLLARKCKDQSKGECEEMVERSRFSTTLSALSELENYLGEKFTK